MESINTTNEKNAVLQLKDVSVSYSPGKYAVKQVSADIFPHTITAIMGPSGCGKSTLLRAINRMHDLYAHIHTSGEIILKGRNVLEMEPMVVRRMAGMVFQQPNPFPTMSIYDNVLAGYSLNGIRLNRKEKEEIVEQSLKSVSLWEEVKDVMNKRGSFLSGGQQQRLCIARTLALKPEVLKDFTIIVVTHNMSQAARISDNSMFMYLGELVEHGNTTQMFTKPRHKRTEEYLTGVFG